MIRPSEDWARQELTRWGFVPDPEKNVVVVDPGYGRPDIGAAQRGVADKTVNLRIAVKLKAIREADGFKVVLTRESNQQPYTL